MALQCIYTVRHGEAEGNKFGRSQTPVTPLTEEGHEQAKRVAQRVKHLEFEHLFASNMTRAQETASYIADETGASVITVPALHEVLNPTEFQDIPHDDSVFRAYFDRRVESFKADDRDWKETDGESFADVEKRVHEVMKEIEQHEGNIVMVSHGLFLKFFTLSILAECTLTPSQWYLMSMRMQMVNTGVSMFVRDTETNEWSMRTWGDQAHFAE